MIIMGHLSWMLTVKKLASVFDGWRLIFKQFDGRWVIPVYYVLLFIDDVIFQRQHVKDHFAPKHPIEIMHVIKE